MKKLPLFLLIILLFTACKEQPALPEILPTPEHTTRPSVSPKPSPDEYKNYDLRTKIDGSTATIPLSEEILLNRLGDYDGLTHNRTHEAYLNLIDGKSDLIFVTYPSDEEFKLAMQGDVELEIIPVVKDALVFLCNTANGVNSLTQQQVRDIYTGELTNWSQAGGKNEPITAFQRPENSGSQTLFLKLAMDGLTPTDPPQELRPLEMGGLVDAVADYNNAENALGYSVFYYVSDMYGTPDVRLMAINGITPTRETIAAGTYPYITYYYAVIRKDTPENHPVRELINWLLTDEGQAVAQTAGYVPMRVLNGRLDESGYGFYGSTPENTSKSSGTGGTTPKTIDTFSNKWRSAENVYNVDLSSDPELERMVKLWEGQALQGLGTYDDSYIYYSLCGDLLNVTVNAYNTDEPSRSAYAVFDLNERKRIKLSDLFYDGVNYIEYINSNLLNQDTKEWYITDSDTFEGYYQKRPFTGIPNDYSNFNIVTWDGASIHIYIEKDNPFFMFSNNITLQVPLPADLSPWGLLYSRTNDRMDVNDDLEIAYPKVQTETRPTPVDDVINAKFRALAETAAQNQEIEIDKEHLALVREEYYGSDYKYKFQPVISIWNGNMSVGYNKQLTSTDAFWYQDFIITVNLRTGETVDAADYVSENWYEMSHHAEIDGKQDENYVPPEGSTIENVFMVGGFCTFIVVEADGKRVPARVFFS